MSETMDEQTLRRIVREEIERALIADKRKGTPSYPWMTCAFCGGQDGYHFSNCRDATTAVPPSMSGWHY